MATQSTYQKKQIRAYALAEADGFRQHPDVYWHQAEKTPIKIIPNKASPKKGGPKKRPVKAKEDKLTLIEGIGPKIASILTENGIVTFADLASAKVANLSKILKAAGPRFSMHKPNSWPKQAKLARDGKMHALKKLQDKLDGGR